MNLRFWERDESSYAKRQRIHRAFVNVFGEPDKRTEDQQIVYDEMRTALGVDTTVFKGPDPISAAINDGMRRAFFVIEKKVLSEPMAGTENKAKKEE